MPGPSWFLSPVARVTRTLGLTSPLTSGPDVARVQRVLGVDDDGLYGPVTAGAAAHWKYASGYPEDGLEGTLSPDDQRRLLDREPLPPGYAALAPARAAALAAGDAAREHAVVRMERWAGRRVRERPPGSDRVPALVRLARRLAVPEPLAAMGYPWCALAALLPALEAGGRSAALGLNAGAFNPLYCPAILTEAEHGRSGLRVVTAAAAARGDLVLFDWAGGDPADHLGRLREPVAAATVSTVDGNAGAAVMLRERPLGQVRAFVRDT
ncbi:MAG: hypothetical protein IT201_03955 [Thermoleophilia bacterium]|nr:hypothetical protein [Thermoleophilia bacterium]